jgi:hypothetical protein
MFTTPPRVKNLAQEVTSMSERQSVMGAYAAPSLLGQQRGRLGRCRFVG